MGKAIEGNAISAYTNFLLAKNIDTSSLELRIKFVKRLTLLLYGKYSRTDYGKAVQAMLKVEGNIERQQQLNISREFYPFLVGNIKAIIKISDTYGFDLTSTKIKTLPTSLDWPSIETFITEPLGKDEVGFLNAYILQMKKENNFAENVIEARLKLVKIQLLTLRDIPMKKNIAYRMAINLTLPLFNSKDIKQQYLDVVREFFYVWMEK
ncbi:MAG: hypothetical protein ACKE5Q_00725 [Methylophilaceae bacterium]